MMGTIITHYDYTGSNAGLEGRVRDFMQLMEDMALLIPTVLGVVLGVGSMAGDLEPRLMGFWRSRPVQIGAFFWSKYAVALAGVWVLLVVLLGSVMVWHHMDISGWRKHPMIFDVMDMARMAGWLSLVVTVTMFLYVLIRRAIYAVVLTAVVLMAIYWGAESCLSTFVEWVGRVMAKQSLVGLDALASVSEIGILLAAAAGVAVLTRVALGLDWRVGGDGVKFG
jgi:hypothetical protein